MDDLFHLHPHGLFLRGEAIAAGYRDADLGAARRAGTIERVRHGTYVPATTWNAGDDVWRYRLRGQGVLLRHPDRVMLSHTSAAAEHGLRLWEPDLSQVHVTRLDRGAGGRSRDVVHHTERGHEGQRRIGVGLVAGPVQAALGAASLGTIEQGLVTVDSLLALGLAAEDEVGAAYRARAHVPFSRPLQVVVRLSRPGSGSLAESRFRFAFFGHGIPEPVLQYRVHTSDGELIGITDFAWPGHGLLGEVDGRQKYGKLLRPGQDVADAIYQEKLREDALREVTGFRMIRYTWADLDRIDQTIARTRRMLAGST